MMWNVFWVAVLAVQLALALQDDGPQAMRVAGSFAEEADR